MAGTDGGQEIGDLELSPQSRDPSRREERSRSVLAGTPRIAVWGASDNDLRKSYRVVRFLAEHGLNVVPVSDRPAVAGLAAVASLDALDPPPDVVVVFCTPDEVVEVAAHCAAKDIPAVWFQEGLIDAAAARSLEEAGKVVIMDRCIMRDYRRQVLGEEVESWFPV